MSSVLPQPPPAPSTPIHQVTLLTMCEVTFTYIPSASSLPGSREVPVSTIYSTSNVFWMK